MDPWQQSTLRANTEFKLACYGNAILMHNQALDHARQMFADQCACCAADALSKVLISHFNLADCYKALEQYERAADCFLAALNFLVQAQGTVLADEQARERFLHAHSHLHAMWSDFIRLYGANVPYKAQLCYHSSSAELVHNADAMAVKH